jgi:drug/metabolite transporter (DMT)-like permease
MNRRSLQMSAAFVSGYMLTSQPAHANNFSNIAQNIITSMANLPGLLSGVSYMFGILIGVLGILKIKDHVENPNNTPLKDGAIRLAAGGGLFALPIVYQAMFNTIGNDTSTTAAALNQVTMGTAG